MNFLSKFQGVVSQRLQLPLRKQRLKKQYVDFSYSVLVKYVMPNLNSFVRHLIVEKGLDPDFVPTPPEPKVLTQEQVVEKLKRLFTDNDFLKIDNSEKWIKASFKDPSKHPVLKSRLEFEGKKINPAPLTIPINEPLQVTLSNEVIDNFHTTIKHVEEVVVLPEPGNIVKPKRPRRRKKAKHDMVTKNFGGNFFRINDK